MVNYAYKAGNYYYLVTPCDELNKHKMEVLGFLFIRDEPIPPAPTKKYEVLLPGTQVVVKNNLFNLDKPHFVYRVLEGWCSIMAYRHTKAGNVEAATAWLAFPRTFYPTAISPDGHA